MYSLKLMHVFSVFLNYSSAQKEVVKIRFSILLQDGVPSCKCPHYLNPAQENQKFQIKAKSNHNVSFAKCSLRNGEDDFSPFRPFLNLDIHSSKRKIDSDEKQFDYSMNERFLHCIFGLDTPAHREGIPIIFDGSTNYTKADCFVQLFVDRETPGQSEGRGIGTEQNNESIIIIICSVVGCIVVLIIVGQTIALLYFKSRAQVRTRLDSLVTRDRLLDRNDEARYSAPPSRRNTKTNRTAADTDSHIYEMVGVNALYKESIELDVKNRPPLPLPGETPVPPPVSLDTLPRPPKSKLLSSTLSLDSISSSSQLVAGGPKKKELPPLPMATSKAPCRPPKQVEENLPGSLRRPPKPLALSKTASSMPKMPSSDPALLELKSALKKRNMGNASPKSTPPSTIERKPPPKTPAKPQPATLPKPKPPVDTNQLPPPNLKLILPKIEECLKSPPTKPFTAPPALKLGRPPEPEVPSTMSPEKPVEAPAIETSRPLPAQVQDIPRPLPPIQSEEDLNRYSDDEDWNYEQLEQYNIYNI